MNYKLEEIGKKIKNEREKRGWSQARLGEKLHVSGKQISLYENGSLPPINNLLNMCNIFDCELGYLIGETSYNKGTKLNTQIHNLLGLTNESINKLQYYTSPQSHLHFGYEYESFREIINHLICSDNFEIVLDALHNLNSFYISAKTLDDKLYCNFDKDTIDEAFAAYCSSDDYANNPSLKPLSKNVISAYKMIDSLIDEQRDLSYSNKVARYELTEAFLKLINEMFPTQTNH